MIDGKRKIPLKLSEFVQKFMFLDGRPISFDDCQYIVPVYDTPHTSVLLMSGRQVAKSVSIAMKAVSLCAINPNFDILIVHPTQNQSDDFAKQKLIHAINSPFIKKLRFTGKYVYDRIFYKRFNNNSSITLRSCHRSGDRVRGISANATMVDELQDILAEEIPVILETLSGKRVDRKYQLYAGTPKTHQHSIQQYWEESTQNEWMIKCSCGFWNRPGIENVQEQGLSCKKCGKLINPANGQYVSFNRDGTIDGYRMPQIITSFVPWKYNKDGYVDPLSIWHKFKTYPESLFYNEVLGLPYDNATQPITALEIKACCLPDRRNMSHVPDLLRQTPLVAGIDWGNYGPGTTVLVIGGVWKHKIHVVYIKRFMGKANELVENEIYAICRAMGVKVANADFRGGWGPNINMRRWMQHQFCTTDYATAPGSSRMTVSDKTGSIIVNRTGYISEVLSAIKLRQYAFPRWEDWEPFSKDFTNVFVDVDKTGAIKYDHRPDKPDDALHALLYMTVGLERVYGTKLVGNVVS